MITKARNPKTGAEVSVPEGRRVKFEAGKMMAERVASGAPDGVMNNTATLATGSTATGG
ncbi:MAG: HU family DNA-binding protein [Planctomycetota bacterium]|nr:HU family DNA-binding protein [Planctomycetota bacterium]